MPRAAASQNPKRLIFVGLGYGVTRDSWFPDQATPGSDYELPPGLAPLARHKADLTIVQNLHHQHSHEAHWGSTFWLTGADRYAVAGRSFSNSVSVDQVAAAHLGQDTRYRSIQLDCANPDGHGPGQSLAWNHRGEALAGWSNPVLVFQRLFGAPGVSIVERQRALADQRSVLDVLLGDASGVYNRLDQTDQDKFAEYLQSIRDIEQRLSQEKRWLGAPAPVLRSSVEEPQPGLTGHAEIQVMYDLMIAALETDTTRVVTYRLPNESLMASLGLSISAHSMSHYENGERLSASQARDLKNSELIAHLIDRLKASICADGSRLLDHVTLVVGSNLNSIHHLTNCPTLIAGGGAGLQHGRNVVLDQAQVPLCNLWLSLLRANGLPVASHGDSTGTLPELFA